MFPSGLTKDVAGNPNLPASLSVVYDVLRPSVSINVSYDQHKPARSDPIYFKIRWSEVVVGFNESLIQLSGTANPVNITLTADPYE
jgi:hypothetical protein